MATAGTSPPPATSVERNKATVRRFIDEIWTKGNLSVIDENSAATLAVHDPAAPRPLSPREYKDNIAMLRAAFPDLQFTVEDLFAEGDRVVVRWTIRGPIEGRSWA